MADTAYRGASRAALERLHAALLDAIVEEFVSGRPLTAAFMNVVRGFLKDLPPELVHQVAQSVEHAYQRPSAAMRPRQPSWSPGFMGTERVSRNGGDNDVPARAQATFKAGSAP